MIRSLTIARSVCSQCRLRIRIARRFASTDTPQLKPARTRFAPSPTGNLHLGSLRTALFNYLWAKRTGGQFILRIEDTDVKRTVPGAEKQLLEDLQWAGLQWDEGPLIGGECGPYRQSERVQGTFDGSPNIYKQHAQKLLDSGHAYRCFCSPEELAQRAQQRSLQGLRTEYDGKCSHISIEQSQELAQTRPFAVRMRDTGRSEGWDDLVFGAQGTTDLSASQKVKVLPPRDDYILLKRDDWPTYHLANVVDDRHMKITHVIRGAEWLKSTPKHVALYKAFGWEQPLFAHVGLLRDASLGKLSKRDMRYNLEEVKRSVLPEALMNFLVLLGWKHEHGRSEVYDMAELVEAFYLQFNKTNPIVAQQKLEYLQAQHFKRRCRSDHVFLEAQLKACEESVKQVYTKESLAAMGIGTEDGLKERVRALFVADEYTEPKAWADKHSFAFSESQIWPQAPVENAKVIRDLKTIKDVGDFDEASIRTLALASFENRFSNDPGWSSEILREWTEDVITRMSSPIGEKHDERPKLKRSTVLSSFHAYLRQWIAWGQSGQGMVDTMLALGHDVCLERIKNGRAVLREPPAKNKLRI